MNKINCSVCVCVCVCVCVHIHVHGCKSACVWMHVCTCVYVHVFAYGCIIYSQPVCSVHTRHTTYGSAACGTDSAGQEQQMIQPGGVTEREDR